MKKNIVLRIAAVVLMLSLVTACFASSTFAKYTAAATGETTLKVAKWSIVAGKDSANAVEIAGKNDATFEILNTITDTNAADAQASDLICPGTQGEFSFYLKNDSEVKADYTITLDKTGLAGLADVITFTDNNTLTGTLDKGGEKTVTVTWEWPFEQTGKNPTDTALGMAASTYKLAATINVDQAAD